MELVVGGVDAQVVFVVLVSSMAVLLERSLSLSLLLNTARMAADVESVNGFEVAVRSGGGVAVFVGVGVAIEFGGLDEVDGVGVLLVVEVSVVSRF